MSTYYNGEQAPKGSAILLLSATNDRDREAVWRLAESTRYARDRVKLLCEPFNVHTEFFFVWLVRLA